MKSPYTLAAALLSLTVSPAGADAPRVAADIAPVHALVDRVMQGVEVPELILPQDASPHGYALRPSQAAALQEANLVVWMGPMLSPWLDGAVDTLSEDARHLNLLEVPDTTVLDWRDGVAFEIGDHDHGHDDDHDHNDDHGHDDDHAHGDEHGHDDDHDHGDQHDHGDEHAHKDDHGDDHGHEDAHDHDHSGGADPHAWLDPVNAGIWLGAIAEELARLDPENAEAYRANATAGQAEMSALEAELNDTLAAAKGLRFVVSHDAFQYFETRFGLPARAAISDSDAAPVGAQRMSELRGLIDAEEVDCVLVEPGVDEGRLATVLGEENRFASIDPLGQDLTPGAALYPALLRAMADAMLGCASR